MHALILQLTRVTTLCLTVFALGCFALLSTLKVFGVVPSPDGGYGPPDYNTGNTAEGEDALLNPSLGTFNTATGYRSSLTTGQASPIPPLALGRFLTTPEMTIRPQTPKPFWATQRAVPTRPTVRQRFFSTRPATTTRQ